MAAVVPLAGRTHGAVDWASLLLFLGGMFAALVALRSVRTRLTRDPKRRRVIIVGTGPRALRIYRELCSDILTPYSVLGFVDSPDHREGERHLHRASYARGTGGPRAGARRRACRRGSHRAARQVTLPRDPGHDPDLRAPRREGSLPGRYRRHRAGQGPRPSHVRLVASGAVADGAGRRAGGREACRRCHRHCRDTGSARPRSCCWQRRRSG